jgi:phosphate acetyltransferase
MSERSSVVDAVVNAANCHLLFERLIQYCEKREAFPVAVCWPCSAVSLAGAMEAAKAGIVHPLLVGPERELNAIAASLGLDLGAYEIIPSNPEENAAAKAVELCRNGRATALMKGSLPTDLLMHAACRKMPDCAHRAASAMCLSSMRLSMSALFITDAAINIYPTLEDKVDIVQNAIDLAHVLGIVAPRVAILSAVEMVNPKILSTIDAAALCKMADRGQITGWILDGPLAFDTAVNAEAARVKNLKSLVAGEADILLVPDLESGNMLAKQLEYLGGARLAGIVLGAKVPIILTSRADSPESRVASCAIASALIERQAHFHCSTPWYSAAVCPG